MSHQRREFAARQVVGRRVAAIAGARSQLAAGPAPPDSLLQAMVLGLDDQPRVMDREEVQALGDYFTTHLLLKGQTPLTLAGVDAGLAAVEEDVRLKVRDVFAVAEGAPFAGTEQPLEVNARIVLVWRKDDASRPDFMVSTVAAPDDPAALLQVIAWSESQGAFHFFDRSSDGHGWVWGGHSYHALITPTRGKGPFDSHVNGSLVMKELKEPWPHWQSMSSTIAPDVLFPTPEIRAHQLFTTLAGAELLEDVVRGGIRRWTSRRIQTESKTGTLANLHRYARQLVTTTTVNLTSSKATSSDDSIDLPASFFLDVEGLSEASAALTGAIGAPPITDAGWAVRGPDYRSALAELGTHVSDREQMRVEGDTHFAFIVPERAFEDLAVVSRLMTTKLLSPTLVLSSLMVDFPNPVFSPRRAQLLKHFPDTATGAAEVDEHVLAAVNAATTPDSAEEEFLSWWNAPDLPAVASAAIAGYVAAVQRTLQRQDGLLDLLRLAAYRRQRFRQRPLAEFAQTVPDVDVQVAPLRMTIDGRITPLPTD